MDFSRASVYAILVVSFAGLAVGRLPRLKVNRAGIALIGAILLVASGGLPWSEAFAAVDVETLALLLAMMIIVAHLRLSGFFELAASALLPFARNPRLLLGVVIASSGILSALFLNDTICIMLTPFVAELCRRSNRDGRPYLIGLAVAANAGSCATSIGNPQNMLIAARSGLSFTSFLGGLGIPSLFALAVSYAAVLLVFHREFSPHEGGAIPISRSESRLRPGNYTTGVHATESITRPGSIDRHLMGKSLIAASLLILLLALGVRTSLAALGAAAFLLITRRTEPGSVYAHVDFTLLVFFSGLFVLTKGVSATPFFQGFITSVGGFFARPGLRSALAVAGASNLVSNVPAVMLLSPLSGAAADPRGSWLMLAMASTFAGNLTLLGSVANLIVAEEGAKSGISIKFTDYLAVGLPVTILSLAFGSFWISGPIL